MHKGYLGMSFERQIRTHFLGEQLTPIANLQFSSSSLPHGKHNFFDRDIRRVKLEQHLHRE